MNKYHYFLLILMVCFYINGNAQENIVQIQKSDITPAIDGVIAADEWTDATEVKFTGINDPQIKVLVKYNADNLYIAFLNLSDSTNIRRNAEVLIHTAPEEPVWDQNSYWFHASYSNCAAEGEYYNWEDCTMNPPDWEANTFPFKNEHNNIEFKISFKRLQFTPSANTTIRIAFKLSDPLEQHQYWPESATISNPATWGALKF